MKLKEQEAVLNPGNEAHDGLPASLLYVLFPRAWQHTAFPSLVIQR